MCLLSYSWHTRAKKKDVGWSVGRFGLCSLPRDPLWSFLDLLLSFCANRRTKKKAHSLLAVCVCRDVCASPRSVFRRRKSIDQNHLLLLLLFLGLCVSERRRREEKEKEENCVEQDGLTGRLRRTVVVTNSKSMAAAVRRSQRESLYSCCFNLSA